MPSSPRRLQRRRPHRCERPRCHADRRRGRRASPIEGAEQVARFLAALARAAPGSVRLLERAVNGQSGLVKQQDSVTVAVYAFEVAGDRITRVWAILNARKLRPWAAWLAAGGPA